MVVLEPKIAHIGSLLDQIPFPKNLRKLEPEQLEEVCQELRQHFIHIISKRGGHFAAGLGVVELSVALHYIFDTPNDQVVWDVGHQAYVHKMLTGRLAQFETIRQYNGLSGFPKRDESEFDAFGTGHASTSVSAALGMAIASQLKGDHLKHHVAVIGDGALTGGLAFEGLNNAGVSSANLIIVLNDNSISIDPAVGALSQSLEEVNSEGKPIVQGIGDSRSKRGKRGSIGPGVTAVNLGPKAFFESLGLQYYGPIDGHDIRSLVEQLGNIKSEKGPRILHVKTTKGKGFSPAERDQVHWHSTAGFDKVTGKPLKSTSGERLPKYQEIFGQTLVELASDDKRVVGITPAMPSGSSMDLLIEKYPERAFDVGIAEEHAVTFSAGLATQGFKPFCNIYSTFLQRAYDQVIHDVCLQNLPVIFCLDRAGLVGEDGPTHHGVFDIAFLRAIPNLIVSAPSTGEELRNLMYTALNANQPFSIRYPRGAGRSATWSDQLETLPIGKGICEVEGSGLAILTVGTIKHQVLDALKELDSNMTPALYNMRFVKPLDTGLLDSIGTEFDQVLTIEDGCLNGGFGSAVLEYYSNKKHPINVTRLGIPDEFIPHGNLNELHELCGLDAPSILATIESCF